MTGGWAATNTLRELLWSGTVLGDDNTCSWCGGRYSLGHREDCEAAAALALVEAALDAAERVNGYGENGETIWQLGAGQDWQAWHEEKERLRAALRAVREGAAQRVCMICGQPANVSVCDRCCE